MDETKRVPPQRPNDPQTPRETTPNNGPSKEALAMIHRAALAMADRKRVERPPESADVPPQMASPVEPPKTFVAASPPETNADEKSAEAKLLAEFDSLLGTGPAKPATKIDPIAIRAATESQPKHEPGGALKAEPRIAPKDALAALRPLFDDQFRLSFTRPQSASIALAIAVFVVGACGLAAYTWVAAQDWSCRTGLATKYCGPPMAIPKPSAPPPEIPT